MSVFTDVTNEKTKDRIEWLIKNYEELRDDDKKLWLAYACKYHDLKETLGDKYKNFKSFLLADDFPTFESVTRIRRKFQEEGKYHGTKRKQKLESAEDMRDWANRTCF